MTPITPSTNGPNKTKVQNPALPIVSLGPFLDPATSSAELTAAAKSVDTACRSHGFFYLVDHGIPTSTLTEVLDLARRFFLEASDDEKARIRRKEVGEGGDGARGYQKLGENVTMGGRDWHEGIDWYRQTCHLIPRNSVGGQDVRQVVTEKLSDGTLTGLNPWPSFPAQFEEVYRDYIQRVLKLGERLIHAMGLALELNKEELDQFSKSCDQSFWVMRAIGYPPLQKTTSDGDSVGISCGEHTDYGCVTLLLADPTKNALQVKTRDGKWITADPIPGAFVVNIGDMIERWTNGEWKSTLHRVVHTGTSYRVSVPFFFEPNFDAIVKPFETCVKRLPGQEHEAVMYGDHLLSKVRGNFYGGKV